MLKQVEKMKKPVFFEVLGIWLILATATNFSSSFVMYNYLFVGMLATITAITFRKNDGFYRMVISGIGLWLLVAAYVPKFLLMPYSVVNGIISGAALLYFGYKFSSKINKKILVNYSNQRKG